MSFCLHLLLFLGVVNAVDKPACLVGTNTFYVDQFNKATIDPEKDSFLAYYREHAKDSTATIGGVCATCDKTPEASQKLYSLQRAINSAGDIPRECTDTVIKFHGAPGKKNYCATRESAASPPGKPTPCTDDHIAEYLSWTINKAIECLSPANDPIEPEAILKMLNLESGLSFSVSGDNGIGSTQLTTDGILEVEGYDNVDYVKAAYGKDGKLISTKKLHKHAGKEFLDNIISNKKECEPFRKLREYDAHIYPLHAKDGSLILNEVGKPILAASSCQFATMGDGVARNIIDGLGLYLFYRGVDYPSMTPEDSKDCKIHQCIGNSRNADLLLKNTNLNFTSKEDYRKIRSLVGLSIYNSGDITKEGRGPTNALARVLTTYFSKSENAVSRDHLIEILKDKDSQPNYEKLSTSTLLNAAKQKGLIKKDQKALLTAKDFVDEARNMRVLDYSTSSENKYTNDLAAQCHYPQYPKLEK